MHRANFCLAFAVLLASAPCFSAEGVGATNNCPAPTLALGRPHIDFVQTQVLASRVLGPTNSLPGVDAAAMSYDAKGTRAVTVLFRFPVGWSMERAHYLDSDQEFLVLSGEIEFDNTLYGPGAYAYLPAGLHHDLLRSPRGAVVLNFYEGQHLAFYTDAPHGMYQPNRLIRHVDTNKLAWREFPARDPRAASGLRYKILRRDRQSGEETWLIQSAPMNSGSQGAAGTQRISEAVEEMFVIKGEVVTPRGSMRSGAYAWLAPNTPIGPMYSAGKFEALVRSKGGAPRGKRVPAAITQDATYRPCLPDALQGVAFKPYDLSQLY